MTPNLITPLRNVLMQAAVCGIFQNLSLRPHSLSFIVLLTTAGTNGAESVFKEVNIKDTPTYLM